MPAYNAEKYISESIQSVINQSYSRWELLIVNDGSNDNTEEKIKLFVDPRIRYSSQDNQGVSAARNVGLADMQGDYFCFLDADDVMPPRSLESRLAVFAGNNETAFVDGRVLVKDICLQYIIRTYQPAFLGNPYAELLNISERCFFGPTWMIRRDKSHTYQFKEGLTHGEDLLFYLSIADQGLYATTEEEVLWYRAGNHSAMSNLEGLKQGYAAIYRHLKYDYPIALPQLATFKRKIRSIMAKSYLGYGQPVNALRSFYELSRL